MRNSLTILALLLTAAAFSDTIHLRNATFDPSIDVPNLDPRMTAAPTGGPAYYLVSLDRPTTPNQRRNIEARTGVDIVAYVPVNAFVVRAEAAQVRRLRAQGVWVGRFEPAFKLASDIGARQLFSETRQLDRAPGTAGAKRARVS